MNEQEPSPKKKPSENGRDGTGRFVKGNKLGKGNPYNDKIAQFRRAMFAQITDETVGNITASLVEQAEQGSIKHQQLFFDITGLRVKQHEINMTTQEISAEEAQERVKSFFNL